MTTDNESPTAEETTLPVESTSDADAMTENEVDAAIQAIADGVRPEPTPETEVEEQDEQSEEPVHEEEELVDEEADVEEDEVELETEEEETDDGDEYDFADLDKNAKITIGGVTKTRSQWDALAGQEKATGTKARKAAEDEKKAAAVLKEAENAKAVAMEQLKTAGNATKLNELALVKRNLEAQIKKAEAEGDAYEVVMLDRKLKGLDANIGQEKAKIDHLKQQNEAREQQLAIKAISDRGLDFLVKTGSKESKTWLDHAYKDLGLTEEQVYQASLIPGVAEAIWNSHKLANSKTTTGKKVRSTKTGLPPSGKKVMSKSAKAATQRKQRLDSGQMTDADIDAEILRIASGGRG